jgi:hypothetical protein
MKLSEAILIGSRQTEPILKKYSDFYYTSDGTRIECRCALGAACYAVDPKAPVDDLSDVERLFGEAEMNQLVTIRPEMLEGRMSGIRPLPFTVSLQNAVIRLNDYYKLKREDTAAVIQSLGL